jgi:phospholipid/cholesterol/gamma-HCH transport system substrate-binding protein
VNYTVVGLFVLVLGTALIAVILWLASGGAFQKKYDLYQAISEESVSGLNQSAPVKYNGVEVGKVKDIRLDLVNPERAIMLFAIERGIPVKTDTIAMLKSQGLTGIAHVELSGGSRGAPLLRPGPEGQLPVIPTKPSLAARLENILTNLASKLDSTSNSIAAFLNEENQVAFKSALADIAAVSQTLSGRKEALDKGIASAARTFENTARVTEQVAPLVARIERSANAVEKMGDEVAKTSSSAGKTIDSVGADVKRFTAESLPEFQRLMDEMTVLATSLRRLSEKIEGSPGGLLLGKRPVAPGPGETAAAK